MLRKELRDMVGLLIVALAVTLIFWGDTLEVFWWIAAGIVIGTVVRMRRVQQNP